MSRKKLWITNGLFVLVLFGAYQGWVAYNTYMGEKTLAASDLPRFSLEQAKSLAAEQDKLVLADLSAIWCPSCRTLDRDVFSNPEVIAAITSRFVFARIEYESEDGKAFMKRYNVSGFPTLLILKANGDLVRKLPLELDPHSFINSLDDGEKQSGAAGP